MADEEGGDELAQFATAQSAREAFHRAVSGSPLKASRIDAAVESNAMPSLQSTTQTFDPADAPLPAFLELPALPEDPGLDGFVEAAAVAQGGEGNGEVAQFSASGDAATSTSSTAAPSLLPLLLRAAMLPWEGASCETDAAAASEADADADADASEQQDLCSSLPLRLQHARWLASRVAAVASSSSSSSSAGAPSSPASSDDFADALSSAIEANGRLLVDLEGAAKRAEEGAAAKRAEEEGEDTKGGEGKNSDAANAAGDDDDDDDDSARRLRSLAASLARAQPSSSGWLRVRMVSYRAATRKQQQRLGGRKKGLLSSAGLLFACCSARPPTLEEDGEGGGDGEQQQQQRATLSGEEGGLGGRERGVSENEPKPPLPLPLAPPPPPRSRPLRRRPAAVALVWLRDGDGRSGSKKPAGADYKGGSNNPLPLPPLLRTPPARRGATSVWEVEPAGKGGDEDGDGEDDDRFVPPTKVSTRFCTPVRGPCSGPSSSSSSSSSPSSPPPPPALVFRLRDALGRGRLAAAVAGGDPVIGSGELLLSEVLARVGGRRAAGPVALGVPIFRESENEVGDPLRPFSSYPRELAGVLRVVVDFVCEERLPLPPFLSSSSAPSPSPSSSPSPPTTTTFPASNARTWAALLSLLWRAWEREEEEGEARVAAAAEGAEGADDERRRKENLPAVVPAPPPQAALASPSDLAAGVGGLSPGFEPLERGVARGLLPSGRFLAAARSAAALCRVPAAAQQAALLSLLLERWDPKNSKVSSVSPSSTAVAELAAALWRPLAAAARGTKGLEDGVAAAVSLAGGRAAAAAVGAVESFDLLWQGQQQDTKAARATLELCALGVTWSPRVAALAGPLAAHVRRAARRMVRRAVVAAFEEMSRSSSSSRFSSSAKRGPSRTSLALAAASAACDAARRGIELDSALAPAFFGSSEEEEEAAAAGGGGEDLEGLDLVAVAGGVRVSAALALLRSALRGSREEDDDEYELPAPPAYGAAAQRLEDAARALSAALERQARKRGGEVCGGGDGDGRRRTTTGQQRSFPSSSLPSSLDVDELFEPCISSALWGLRPLALAWVDRTLRPKEVDEGPSVGSPAAGGLRRRRRSSGGLFGSAAQQPPPHPATTTTAASASSLIWRPVSRAAGALYCPAVVDLYSLIASATDGLGARALARPPRGERAALRHAAALAAALAPAPARMAALTEAALEGEFFAAAAASEATAAASAFGEDEGIGSGNHPWWKLGLGGGGGARSDGAGRGGGTGANNLLPRQRRVPLSAKPPKAPHPLSNAACVQLSSLFELRARAEDADGRLRQMLSSDSFGDDTAPSSSAPRLAANVELAARLSSAASRGAAVVAGRLGERLRWEFARAADEANDFSLSSSSSSSSRHPPPAADFSSRAAALVVAELESLDGRLSREALSGVARALWRVSVAAAESVLLSAVVAPSSPSSSSGAPSASTTTALSAEEAEAVLLAAEGVADALDSLSGPVPLPRREEALEPLLERLRSLAALARSPTAEVAEAARLLWAAAAARGARACASSGLLGGGGKGGSHKRRSVGESSSGGRRRGWSLLGGGGGDGGGGDEGEEEDSGESEEDDDGEEADFEAKTPPAATAGSSSSSPSPPPVNPLLAAASKFPGLAYADAVALLSSRAAAEERAGVGGGAGAGGGGSSGGEAARAASEAAAHAAGRAMTAVFGLRAPEPVVATFECRASCAGGARGTLFLSERYLAFAKAGHGADVAGGARGAGGAVGGASGLLPFLSPSSVAAAAAAAHDAANGGFGETAASYPPLAVFKLSRLARMERCRRQRSRGLALWERGSESLSSSSSPTSAAPSSSSSSWAAPPPPSSSLSSPAHSCFLPAVEPSAAFWEFSGPGGRDEAEATIRVHVMGSGSALDRFLRGLPPPPPPRRQRGRTKEEGGAKTAEAAAAAAAAPSPLPPPPPPPPPPFIPDRVFEVRLASSGPLPGWGGGAWCVLRVSSQGGGSGAAAGAGGGGLSLDSDECSPRRVVAAPWLLRVSGDPRPLRTSRALAQGAGVAVTARWSGCGGEDGDEGEGAVSLAVGGISNGGGDDDEEEQAAPPLPRASQRRRSKLPPLQTLRLAGMSPEEAADLCLEIRSRVAAAAAGGATSAAAEAAPARK